MTTIQQVIESREFCEIGRAAVEDALIDYRDSGISILNRGNGLCIRTKHGEGSSIIRLGMEKAIVIALEAIQEHQETIYDKGASDE